MHKKDNYLYHLTIGDEQKIANIKKYGLIPGCSKGVSFYKQNCIYFRYDKNSYNIFLKSMKNSIPNEMLYCIYMKKTSFFNNFNNNYQLINSIYCDERVKELKIFSNIPPNFFTVKKL